MKGGVTVGKGRREPTQQTAFRLPLSLLERVDAYAARLARETPGLNPARADAVRSLLTQALDAVEGRGEGRASVRTLRSRRQG